MESLQKERENVYTQGFSILDQELEVGVRLVAVPIRRHPGDEVIASVNISTNVSRVTKAKLIKEYLPVLTDAAAKIESIMPEYIL